MADLTRIPSNQVQARKPTQNNPMGIYHYESIDVDCTWSLLSGAWTGDKPGKLNITKVNDVVTLGFSTFQNLQSASATAPTIAVCSFNLPVRFRPKVSIDEYNQDNDNAESIFSIPTVENAVQGFKEVAIFNNPSLSEDDPTQGFIRIGGVADLSFNIRKTTISYKTKSFLNE